MAQIGRVFRLLVATAAVVAFTTACGSSAESIDGPADGDGGPRVANARFDGDFIISDVTFDGRPVPLETVPTINFETVFGGLTVKPGCNTYFGSFTLAEDGTASITVPGGTSQDCGGLGSQEEAVLAALAEVTSWAETDDGFRLAGPSGSSLTMTR